MRIRRPWLSPSFVTHANSVTLSKAFAPVFSAAKWGCANTPLMFNVVHKSPSGPTPMLVAGIMTTSPCPQAGFPPHTGALSSGCHTQLALHMKKKGKGMKIAPGLMSKQKSSASKRPYGKRNRWSLGCAEEAQRRAPTHLCPPRRGGGARKEMVRRLGAGGLGARRDPNRNLDVVLGGAPPSPWKLEGPGTSPQSNLGFF